MDTDPNSDPRSTDLMRAGQGTLVPIDPSDRETIDSLRELSEKMTAASSRESGTLKTSAAPYVIEQVQNSSTQPVIQNSGLVRRRPG
jgi:hypothetical protein